MTRAHLVVAMALAAVIFAAGFGSAWAWRSALADSDLAGLGLAHEKERGEISQAVAAELQRRAKDRQELQAQYDGIDQQRYQELRHVQEVNDQLARDLAAAQRWMYAPVIGGGCTGSAVRSGSSGPGLDDAAGYAELRPEAAADLARIAADANACALALTALQERERARQRWPPVTR
ncbi:MULTISPECIES: lysis system i-spanin subunit Rz [Pseudomonas]|uniref:lysis system i-spanin subunit Rz n=1 Tax=Pseudomonas nitroreducens TaxID=46680 RepID=UPI001E55423C|nr:MULTISPECIES: lysis system i-spanin subunit Rz [Pseudomonas]MCE4070107.1 lysis protein [Pseudomonas nitritireducens]MCE4078712.1 lysis protein [Pseudomonas nitroreducens]